MLLERAPNKNFVIKQWLLSLGFGRFLGLVSIFLHVKATEQVEIGLDGADKVVLYFWHLSNEQGR